MQISDNLTFVDKLNDSEYFLPNSIHQEELLFDYYLRILKKIQSK